MQFLGLLQVVGFSPLSDLTWVDLVGFVEHEQNRGLKIYSRQGPNEFGLFLGLRLHDLGRIMARAEEAWN
jgi:hypothetical protein